MARNSVLFDRYYNIAVLLQGSTRSCVLNFRLKISLALSLFLLERERVERPEGRTCKLPDRKESIIDACTSSIAIPPTCSPQGRAVFPAVFVCGGFTQRKDLRFAYTVGGQMMMKLHVLTRYVL